jgi:hypothetical protein
MDRIDVPLTKATWHPGGRAYYEGTEGARDCTGEELCDYAADFHRRHLSTSHAVSETYVEYNLLRAEGRRHILLTGHGRYLDKWYVGQSTIVISWSRSATNAR